MRSNAIVILAALLVSPSAGSAADWAFIASRQPFAVAYTVAGTASDSAYHIVIISNLGAESIEIRLGAGDRPSEAVYATIAPGAAATFVTRDSLFVSCAGDPCRVPVEVNYLQSF